jgi:hypothetical protein
MKLISILGLFLLTSCSALPAFLRELVVEGGEIIAEVEMESATVKKEAEATISTKITELPKPVVK